MLRPLSRSSRGREREDDARGLNPIAFMESIHWDASLAGAGAIVIGRCRLLNSSGFKSAYLKPTWTGFSAQPQLPKQDLVNDLSEI
jgi:hypothetical protein